MGVIRNGYHVYEKSRRKALQEYEKLFAAWVADNPDAPTDKRQQAVFDFMKRVGLIRDLRIVADYADLPRHSEVT